jgi:putative serine protease PepD
VTPTPEEPLDEGPDRDDSGGSPDVVDPALRGWIDPDDRLWRHPSELAAGATRSAAARLKGTQQRTMILIGAAATLAAVAWAIVLLSPVSDHPASSPASDNAPAIPLPTLAVQNEQVPASAQPAGRSMVELQADTTHGVVSLVGVAVAEGGLVATTADGLSGLRRLSMIGPGGRQLQASVVGVDDSSDLALISVPEDIPVAPFADDSTLLEGSAVLTLSMAAPDAGSVALHCTAGSVTAVDATIATGWAKGMPDITSSTTAVNEKSGDPLLNQAGDVIGILYAPGPSPSFLPTQLVLGVSDDLRSTGRVSHGWLGVEGATPAGTTGARVAAVMPGSPATGLLRADDVVVALNSVPIRSMADLRARLYVLPPDSTVGLAVTDGSTTRVVDVTLRASP